MPQHVSAGQFQTIPDCTAAAGLQRLDTVMKDFAVVAHAKASYWQQQQPVVTAVKNQRACSGVQETGVCKEEAHQAVSCGCVGVTVAASAQTRWWMAIIS
eukprot:GHUV01038583.1.p2 GENE.GHUV01038583.1~~GHUV01038583.1.p2  ORF type:complete len:100 (+),score=30.22 GHUV01038583.1:361-660(+)